MEFLTTRMSSLRVAQILSGSALALLVLTVTGCNVEKGGGKQNSQTDLPKAVLGKWGIISDNPTEKDTTLDITPKKWVWNNPASLATQIKTMTFTYTISGDQLTQKQGKLPPIKSKIHIADDVMTITLRKEENRHLYSQDTGEVVTKYERVK